jgi:D-aspartate ligase
MEAIVRAARNSPPVVIAGAYQTAVVLMRNLARRGVKVCCFDCDRDNPGFHTVYGQAFLCPNPDGEPDSWLNFMIDLSAKIGERPVLISSADQFVSAIARHAQALEKWFAFCQEGIPAQSLLATKERQYEAAAAHGLPVPESRLIRSDQDAMVFGSTARFPCLLKPLHFREWERFPRGHPLHRKKLVLAHCAQELLEQYRFCSSITPELMAQEVIEGPDDAKLVYLSCYDRDGRRLGVCLLRELRTMPIGFGSASVVEPAEDPEADALCDGFLRGIGYAGICEIELKRDSRDGRLKMIEANPRYSVTADAAPYAGVDLGWLHYLDLIGVRVEPVRASTRRFRHIVLRRDLATIRSYRREGLLSWAALLKSYLPPVAFFDFDIRDWRVTGMTILDLARIVLRPIVRRVFPRRHSTA